MSLQLSSSGRVTVFADSSTGETVVVLAKKFEQDRALTLLRTAATILLTKSEAVPPTPTVNP